MPDALSLIAGLYARVAILEAREEVLRGLVLSELRRADPEAADYIESHYESLISVSAQEKSLAVPEIEALFLKHIRQQLGISDP